MGGKEVRVTGWIPRMAQLEGDGYEFLDDPEPMLAGLRECGVRIDLFTFTQKLSETDPKYRFPMEWDNFAAVQISSFEDWWSRQIRPEARNRVRTAEKRGVIVREVPFNENLVKGIWAIYNESPVRQGRRFPHYGKPIAVVHQEEATFLERSFFLGAYLGQNLIGFAKLTVDETWTQANFMNILAAIEHRDKAPTNALLAQAVRSCVARNIPYLVYQKFSYGYNKADGLMRFKQVNGFRRFDVPRYYVPFTTLGRVSLALGVHRRLADRIPESLRMGLRSLRAGWHSRAQNCRKNLRSNLASLLDNLVK